MEQVDRQTVATHPCQPTKHSGSGQTRAEFEILDWVAISFARAMPIKERPAQGNSGTKSLLGGGAAAKPVHASHLRIER